MLFNSYEFIFLFLPITLAGYFLIGKKSVRASNLWLLAASLFFYGWWDVRFVPLLLGSIVWNFLFGTKIRTAQHKKLLLLIAVAVNLALLGYCKYTDFFITTVNRFAHTDWNLRNIVLPLGISFWTFTQTAFLVDAYRGKNEPCSFWDYALFVLIFPHLIAGPIINHAEMLPQFKDKARHTVNWENMARGITLFVFGLFKKVVIADSLAPIANDVFARAATLPMLDAWLGVLAYTFQLYFDFSAYSEMAVGLGKMLNIEFPTNFDSPYKSVSPIEFWRRWHITLGGWIRDYLYIPVGGNRHGQARKMLNLFLCMTLCGFWHGAGFTFIAWGMLHGTLLVINHSWRAFAKPRGLSVPKWLGVALTFLCVMFGWIMFRAGSLADGLKIAKALFDVHHVAIFSETSFFARTPFFQHWNAISLVQEQQRPWSIVKTGGALVALSGIVFFAPNAIQVVQQKYKPTILWLGLLCLLTLYALTHLFATDSVFLYFNF